MVEERQPTLLEQGKVISTFSMYGRACEQHEKFATHTCVFFFISSWLERQFAGSQPSHFCRTSVECVPLRADHLVIAVVGLNNDE